MRNPLLLFCVCHWGDAQTADKPVIRTEALDKADKPVIRTEVLDNALFDPVYFAQVGWRGQAEECSRSSRAASHTMAVSRNKAQGQGNFVRTLRFSGDAENTYQSFLECQAVAYHGIMTGNPWWGSSSREASWMWGQGDEQKPASLMPTAPPMIQQLSTNSSDAVCCADPCTPSQQELSLSGASKNYLGIMKDSLVFTDVFAQTEVGKMLMVGQGSSKLPHALINHFNAEPRFKLTVVDYDAAIVEVNEACFGFPPPGANHQVDVQVADAAEFIHRSNEEYQAIFLDTYGDGNKLPAHLVGSDFFSAVHTRLETHGIMSINTYAKPECQQDIAATIRSVFGNIYAFTFGPSYVFVAIKCPAGQECKDVNLANLDSIQSRKVRPNTALFEIGQDMKLNKRVEQHKRFLEMIEPGKTAAAPIPPGRSGRCPA